jgi:stearoyl-CoA desaturase (Delta-9 desaturase)
MNAAGTSTAPSRAPVSDAMRLQRGLAFTVMALPIIGTVLALYLAFRYGVGAIEIASLGFMYLLTMGGMTIGLHRHFAHKCFDAGPRMRLILAVLGSMAAQGPLLSWVTIHRKHHAFSDRPGDPHSPHVYGNKLLGMLDGLWHAHIGWMFTENAADWSFSRDLMGDRRLFWVHRTYLYWVFAAFALPALGAGLLTRSWSAAALGFLWGGLVRCFVVNQASWCVGSVCHYFGSQRFDTHDHSANNYLVALLTFGEGLQNNHHAFPSAARHGIAWWEPDFSGTVIHLLARLGLVWNLYHPSNEAIAKLCKAA